MKIVRCSEFFTRPDIKPFLLGAFYSRSILSTDGKYFFATSSFKKSKYVFEDDFDLESYRKEYTDVLNRHSGYKNWIYKKNTKTDIPLPRADYIFVLENDLQLTVTTFFRRLSSYILNSDWVYEDGLTEEKKSFLRGFMELRGSIDTNRPLLAQDYFYNNKKEISKAKLIFESLAVPTNVANINFRDLQEQFVSGVVKRNSQLRMDLNWYVHNIGLINRYKAEIFERKYPYKERYETNNGIIYFVTAEKNFRSTNSFDSYINFFSQNIYGQKLSTERINDIRVMLKFDKTQTQGKRNKTVIEIFRAISPDKCAICGTSDTFINAKTQRPHFDIHHMISFKNGESVDVIDNLVKLCNNCHSMMKKGSGQKEDQLSAIRKILFEQENVFEFCSNYLDTDDIDIIACKVQEMLG